MINTVSDLFPPAVFGDTLEGLGMSLRYMSNGRFVFSNKSESRVIAAEIFTVSDDRGSDEAVRISEISGVAWRIHGHIDGISRTLITVGPATGIAQMISFFEEVVK